MATTLSERRQLDRQARRRKIQRVARRIFSERGFAGTTIEEIARRAGLSVGAIYLYFKSKEDLYVSLLQDSLDLLAVELERILVQPGDARAQLRAAWELLSALGPTFREFLRILPSVQAAPARAKARPEPSAALPTLRERISVEVAAALTEAGDRSFALIGRIVEAGVAQGVFRPQCKRSATDLLWATFTGLVALHDARESLELPAPDFAQSCWHAFDTLERGMLA
ncbi:MAG TPA: helix-turn-helix domain-containing protein [Polyangia bacterium]|nr:helix-turn-helix domain-containing protein [Polyangia bacterium]